MLKIRNLVLSDIKKIKKMIEYINPGITSNIAFEENVGMFPFKLLHNVLPISLKFLQENYVAVQDGELLGLIGLVPDSKAKTRWKINRLILHANAHDVGKQLIDFVVNKYGANGVGTFISTIDENYTDAINLFVDACGFRNCTKINVWKYKILPKYNKMLNCDYIREAKASDAKVLMEFEFQCLFPHVRPSIKYCESDYKLNLMEKAINSRKNIKIKKFIFESAPGNIDGLLTIRTRDNLNFWADVVLSLPYENYYPDLINYIVNYVSSYSAEARLYIYVKEFYQTHTTLTEVLPQVDFEAFRSFNILIKDYWRTLPGKEAKKNPILLFTDITSPACKWYMENQNIDDGHHLS